MGCRYPKTTAGDMEAAARAGVRPNEKRPGSGAARASSIRRTAASRERARRRCRRYFVSGFFSAFLAAFLAAFFIIFL